VSTKVITAALVAVAVAAFTGTAVAAAPAGTPDPSAIALRATDFPTGAKEAVAKKIAASGDLVAGYETSLVFSKPYGASHYVIGLSSAYVETSATSATKAYGTLAHLYSSKAGQRAFVKAVTAAASAKVAFAKPRAVGLPDSSMELAGTAIVKRSRTNFSIELFRLDRVLVLDVLIGTGKTPAPADAKALTSIVAAKAKAQLVPAALAAPTVSGTPQQGQTLTASPGTWSNAPATYAYQWQSCDAAGATCVDIAGATASTYAVQPGDVGKTLRVEVTATNGQGATQVPSAATAAVS
jgi:hypothetical protein